MELNKPELIDSLVFNAQFAAMYETRSENTKRRFKRLHHNEHKSSIRQRCPNLKHAYFIKIFS